MNSNDEVVCIPVKPEHLSHPSEESSFSEYGILDDHARKLKVFKQVIRIVGEDRSEGLIIVDAVQRLGIDYHFQDEIHEILQRQYLLSKMTAHPTEDLQEVALRFRLLRQEGYYVSADLFNNFRNKEGEFNEKASEDINLLMEIYEASQLSMEGEDVLMECGDFSFKLLNEWMGRLDDHYQVKIIRKTLAHPCHKSLARFMAKNLFLTDYRSKNGWIHVFQELVKMDFNLVQCLHRKEIVEVSEWWKDLGLAKTLQFARNQPLKWYIWSMASLTDASLSWQRVELTKPISFIYIIDDIFDVYGTLDELTLFTETISKWDLGAIDQLPEYMKVCFEALNKITDDISYKVYREHGYNPVHSLRKAWGRLCSAFLVEAKWFSSGHHWPTAEEYLDNAIVSSGVHVGLVHIFFLLGHNITRDTVQLIDNNPAIISSTATILRLWDDLGSAKDENQDGNDGSYLYYYMKEHMESTPEAAEKHTMDKISDAWKRLNQACLSPSPFSASFIRASLNLARMVPLMYEFDDNQQLPNLEKFIKSLLYEKVPTQGVY